jgi:hypothetical protein
VSGEDYSGGPLDLPTLEGIAQRAATHPLVKEWAFHPDAISPRRLELYLDADQYPSLVEEARLDIRWFEGNDYTVQYLETRGDNIWQCRWDRHPKPGEPKAHFHPPPDAAPDIEPSSLQSTHHLDVLFDALGWVTKHIEQLHDK